MDRVRAIRKAKGITQTQLADAIGANQAAISKIEAGTANPTLHMVNTIAKRLGVQPAALFEMPELQRRVINALENLPPDRREAALLVLEAMSGQGSKAR